MATPDLLQCLLVGLALALGVVAAQIEGPTTWGWRTRASVIYHRLAHLPKRGPGRLTRYVGAVLLFVLLGGGTLAAYAAAPSSAPRAPIKIASLVTSEVRPADGARAGSPPAQNGLAAVGDQTAAATAEAPAQPAYLKAEIASGRWNGKPAWGLDQAQTERLVAYDVLREKILADWFSKNWVPGQMASAIPSRPTPGQIYGSNLADFQALDQLRTNYRVANFAAEMSTPLTGPSTAYVRPDQIPREVLSQVGADPRGTWSLSPADSTGGRTLTRDGANSPDPGVMTSAMASANRGGQSSSSARADTPVPPTGG